MKTLPALAFIAALAAFLLFPLNFEIAGSILFAAGLATIAFCDYARSYPPLRVSAAAKAGVPAGPRTERLGLAA